MPTKPSGTGQEPRAAAPAGRARRPAGADGATPGGEQPGGATPRGATPAVELTAAAGVPAGRRATAGPHASHSSGAPAAADHRPPQAGPPSAEAAAGYEELRGLGFLALSRLAAQGFVAPLDDGLDLIHDFYAEHYAGLLDRWEPARGKFGTYLYGAFVHFARRRIVRERWWKGRLADVAWVAELAAAQGRDGGLDDGGEREAQVAAADAALKALPPDLADPLLAYLRAGGRSERAVARSQSLSRHLLRERLIEAFGRVSVELLKLGEPVRIPRRDLDVIVALWRDTYTVPQAAGYLDLPVPEVRAVRARLVALLAAAVHRSPAPRGAGGRHRVASEPRTEPGTNHDCRAHATSEGLPDQPQRRRGPRPPKREEGGCR